VKSTWAKLRELYRTRRAVRALVDLAAVLLVVALAGLWQTREHPRGVTLPPLTLQRLDGAPVALQSLTGKPALLMFWAPWCAVCRATSDNVSRVMKLAGAHAQVVSIALGYEDRGAVERYVRDRGADYPVLLGDEALARPLSITSFPTFYFVSADGRISGSAVGYTTTVGLLWRLLWAGV
jgi:thiol-disulfide isomerase/thioredoxin